MTGALSSNRPGAFDVTTYPTAADAARAIGDRDAIGGIAVAPTGITIQTAAGPAPPTPRCWRLSAPSSPPPDRTSPTRKSPP